MKTMKPTNRRNFLLAAGLGGASAAAAVAVGTRKPRAATGAVADAQQPSGYRATDHVLKYYKTTKV
jgi:hypothetical protein